MPPRILILIGAHLSTAPRPVKEATALAAAGFDVEVLGFWFDRDLVARDRELLDTLPWRFRPVVDLTRGGARAGLRHNFLRVRRKLADLAFARTGWAHPALLSYVAPEFLGATRRTPADLTIVHMEAGLWAGCRLLEEGRRVGVDFEDWFSRDLPEAVRRTRPVAQLDRWERTLAARCPYALATSAAMANAMAADWDVPPPTAVYNTFPALDFHPRTVDPVDRTDCETPSLHWYSQTIGPGRGLEDLFAALRRVAPPFQLHLRGALPPAGRSWLDNHLGGDLRPRVHLHSTVSPAELPRRIAEHDIGLALETNAIPSRDLTITNKFFQYLQSGLAVVATGTSGQREALALAPEAGIALPSGDVDALANALSALLGDCGRLHAMKRAALAAHRDHFAWERQAPRIVALAEKALSTEAPRR